MNAFTFFLLNPKRRPSTEAMPAPICTEGPSRPSAMPLAKRHRTAKEFSEYRPQVRCSPSVMKIANFVCGIPLPRASGKNLKSR